MALGRRNAERVPELLSYGDGTYRDLWYEERNGVGYLYFPLYGGAMSVDHCKRLRRAIQKAKSLPTNVLALLGGPDFGATESTP